MRYAGELVSLREVEPADLPIYQRWYDDPDVMRYTLRRYPVSLAAMEARFGNAAVTFAEPRWTVIRNDTGEPVGTAALHHVSPESRDGEYDVVIGDRAVWGQGYGTDTTRTVCRYAFDRLGLHRVTLWVFTENEPAIRAYERVGFVREALARECVYKHGRWYDCHVMGLLAGELR